MGLRAVFSPSSSSRRLRAGRAQLNMSLSQGTEMQHVTFSPYFCGCFGQGGVAEIAAKENKGKKSKPLAIFRRFLKRKSKAASTNVLPADEETHVEEARVPVESSRDAGAAITSVDIDIGGLEIIADAKILDLGTYKSSPSSSSSTESHTTITCADREGDHDWIVSPVFLSFRFSILGDDAASTPEILLLDNKLECISLADTCGTITCNGKEESRESMISPILNSSSLTSGSDDGFRTPDILSGISTLEEGTGYPLDSGSAAETGSTFSSTDDELNCELSGSDDDFRMPNNILSGISTLEEGTGYPLDSGFSAETWSTVTSTDDELNCKLRVTLEMLMEMESLLLRDRYDREVEGEFGVSDCVSSLVSRSPFVCWSNQQSRMTVQSSTGSPLFAQPDALFLPSPRPLSLPSHSTVTGTHGAGDHEMTVVLEMLLEMENLVPGDKYDPEAEREFKVRGRGVGSISSSPLVCWSDRQGRMTVEAPFGCALFEHPDTLFPPSPGAPCSPPCSSVTSIHGARDHETKVTLEMLMETENLYLGDGYDREVEGEFGVSGCVSSSVSRSPFVCWSNQQSRMTVEPSSGSPLFAPPDALFPPSPRTLSSPSPHSPSSVCIGSSCSEVGGAEEILIVLVQGSEDANRHQWTIASTSKSGIWESRAAAEMLMKLENLLSEETTGQGVEIEFGVRDHIPRSVSGSPLVCWSH